MEIPNILLESIKDKRCVLFLGAGASYGAIGKTGKIEKIPLGQDLADLLAKKFLDDSYKGNDLTYNAEIAISETSLLDVQKYIHEVFIDFSPAEYHHKIATLPWKAIFSINYDLIIEKVYSVNRNSLQTPIKIIKNDDIIDDLAKSKKNFPFYKLHGCISRISDSDVPLILTIDQYINYLKNRDSLFKSLYERACNDPVVFIGTSLRDTNIRAIINKIEEDTRKNLVRSYLIVPNASKRDMNFWAEKKITVLQGTFEDFIDSVDKNLDKNSRIFALYRQQLSHPIYKKFPVDLRESISSIDDFLDTSCTYVCSEMSSSAPNPQSFYKGYSPDFSPVIHSFDVARELTDEIISECVLPDNDNLHKNSITLIVGHAGAGKSVLLRRIAYDAANLFDKSVFWITNNSWGDFHVIEEIHRKVNEPLYIFIDNISHQVSQIKALLDFSKNNRCDVRIFSADRYNTWNDAEKYFRHHKIFQYELDYLDIKEIDALIALLKQHKSLGYLTDRTIEEQRNAFVDNHAQQLLVALHEATKGKPFSDILYDEYIHIPNETAKELYRTICLLYSADVKIRAGLISRIHDISFEDFHKKFFAPLDHIVFAIYDHVSMDYVYECRHPIIAELLCDKIFLDSNSIAHEYEAILNNLVINYKYDKIALGSIIKSSKLIDKVKDYHHIDHIFDIASQIDLKNPYILQQRGIFEMRHHSGNLDKAKRFLDAALELSPDNSLILHSFATLENRLAKRSLTPIEKRSHQQNAKSIASRLFSSAGDDAYPQTTFLEVCVDELRDLLLIDDDDAMIKKIDEIENMLEKTVRRFPYSDRIYSIEAEFNKTLGEHDKAIKALNKAFSINPSNVYVVTRLAKYYNANCDSEKAKEIIQKGLNANSNSRDLNYLYAKILMGNKYIVNDAVLYHLKKSYTARDHNFEAQFWHARALYITKNYSESREIYHQLQDADIDYNIKKKIRGIASIDNDPEVFHGSVIKKSDTYLFIRPDFGGMDIFAHKTAFPLNDFPSYGLNSRIVYTLGFTFSGPAADSILDV